MNTYLRSAYSDEQIQEAVKGAGFNTFREMVSKFSAEGLSLQQMAVRLDLAVQRFTAYHALWMRLNADPLNLENV